MLKYRLSQEKTKYLRNVIKVSMGIAAAVAIILYEFKSDFDSYLLDMLGLFVIMVAMTFTGILLWVGYIKLSHRARNEGQIPFL